MARLPLVDFRVRWRPYELVPSSGQGRTMRKQDAYLSFMGTAHRVHQYFARLRDEGAQTGIAFEFEGSTSNTLDAHRLAEWALDQHGEDAQDALVTQQFSQYMEHGKPPKDHDSQLAAAASAGLDTAAARAVLEDPRAYADVLKTKLAEVRRDNISGVPYFKLAGAEPVTGAQAVEYWEDVLRRRLLQLHQQAAA